MRFDGINIRNEEFWNTVTHGLGAFLSVIALVLMVLVSAQNGSAMDIVCSLIFGGSLTLLYLASTLYHAARNKRKKFHLRRADHLCIYLLIAGTYTPVMLLGLKGAWGWTMFGCIWGMTFLGFLFKFSSLRKSEKLSLILYAAMGWLAVIALYPLIQSLEPKALLYLGIGGLFYTVGIVFYANEKIPFNHAIWHLFVLGGSISHFIAIFRYILP